MYPSRSIHTACEPDGTCGNSSGVSPTGLRSMETMAPGGFDSTTSVPKYWRGSSGTDNASCRRAIGAAAPDPESFLNCGAVASGLATPLRAGAPTLLWEDPSASRGTGASTPLGASLSTAPDAEPSTPLGAR